MFFYFTCTCAINAVISVVRGKQSDCFNSVFAECTRTLFLFAYVYMYFEVFLNHCSAKHRLTKVQYPDST